MCGDRATGWWHGPRSGGRAETQAFTARPSVCGRYGSLGRLWPTKIYRGASTQRRVVRCETSIGLPDSVHRVATDAVTAKHLVAHASLFCFLHQGMYIVMRLSDQKKSHNNTPQTLLSSVSYIGPLRGKSSFQPKRNNNFSTGTSEPSQRY